MTGRPLLGLSAAFTAGIAAAHLFPQAFPVKASVAAAGILSLVLAGGLVRRFVVLRHPILPLVCFCALGVLASRLAAPTLPAPPSLEPFFHRPMTLFLAEVTSAPEYTPDKIRLPLLLSSAFVEGKPIPVEGGVMLSFKRLQSPENTWLPGDRILVRLTLKRFHNFNNAGGYDYVLTQAERGLYARAYSTDSRFLLRVVREHEDFPMALSRNTRSRLDGFRQSALHWIERSLDPDTGALYAALLLGYQHLIPKALQEHINRAGITHLIVISGSHLALVSMMTFWLGCRLVRFLCPSFLERTSDKHMVLWLAILAAVLYAMLTGLATPTWRALIMIVLVLGAVYWHHFTDPLTALGAAALISLVTSPDALWQVSFQLSFGAVLGLVLLYPRFRKLYSGFWNTELEPYRLMRKVFVPFTDAFLVSLAANVMVLPLIAYHFQGFSLAGLAANTLLVPIVGFLVLPLGLAALGLYAVNEGTALVILKAGAFLLEWCRDVVIWFSELSWAYFWSGAIPLLWLISFYGVLGILLSSWRRRIKAVCILAVVLSAVAVSAVTGVLAPGQSSSLEATFLDVGQGTSTLVRFPSGETMLVDGGGFHDDGYDIGRSVVAPFLWASGIRELDYVVLSHDHPDHRNGLKFILSNFHVNRYWESGLTDDPGETSELAAIAARREIPIQRLSEIKEGISIGECRLMLLHPGSAYIEDTWDRQDLNNVSLVLKVDYRNTHLILPGDIDQSVENLLFENHHPSGHLLVLSPHHGSVHSNGRSLFHGLGPDIMVFSCGYDNWFGFPAQGVLEECRKWGIPYYRTDLHGAVQAESTGDRWKIRARSGNGG